MNIIDKLAWISPIIAGIWVAIVIGSFLFPVGRKIWKYQQNRKLSGLKYASWNNATGFVFGKNRWGKITYVPTEKEGKHTFVLGGSGTGKTSGVIIPCLSHFNGNFFAIDISGDISSAVQRKGSVTFAPCESDTSPYNVFALIDSLNENSQEQYEQLEKLAFLMMPDMPGANDASSFFNTEGRKILTAALIAFYYRGLDFSEICQKIVSSSCIDLFREIDAQKKESASLLIKSFQGTNKANTNGCKQATDRAVKLFALNQNIQNSVRRPKTGEVAVTPSILEYTSVFFRIPESMIDLYSPLMNIVVSQCLAYFANRPISAKPSIFLALDEFASLNMDATSIVGALQRFRKRNISIMLVTQSMAAIDRLYGETTRKDMLNNFSYKVILHAGDADTQMEVAKMIGHKKEKSHSTAMGRGGMFYPRKEISSWAVDPEDLSRLGNQLVLIHPSGFKLLKKAPFYKYKSYLR